jgi:hypothetical protein
MRARRSPAPAQSGTDSDAAATSPPSRRTAPSRPSAATLFGRPRAASRPTGLPMSASLAIASRMSSAIW